MNYKYDILGTKQLSDAHNAEAQRATHEYSVSLINGNDLRGSATLVSIGNAYGLLTADHVWSHIQDGGAEDHFCMLLGSRIQRFEYPFQECSPIVIGAYMANHLAEGPDLTFIRLDNPQKIATLKSQKSFFPLDKQKGELFQKISFKSLVWLLWGAPAERSKMLFTKSGERVRKVTHFVGGSDFENVVERNGFDYLTLKIPTGGWDYPRNYQGFSGGGVWIPVQYSEDPIGNILRPTLNLLLVGVAFYQSKEVAGSRNIACHGAKSIYQRTVTAVESR